MIEYLYIKAPIKVRHNGRICGNIKPIKDRWWYVPKGQKEGGQIFKTIGEVKKSIECMDY